MKDSVTNNKHYIDFFTKEKMYYALHENVFTGLVYANFLGDKFDNCYGQGVNEEQAVLSLRIRVKQLRFPNAL